MFNLKKRSSSSEKKKKIISINAYQERFYQFMDNSLKLLEKPSYDKKNFVVSTLDEKDFISTLIEISVNIPPEDLKDAIELKAYDELELDQAVDYLIRYTEDIGRRDDKYRYFHIFVTEPNVVQETFEYVRQKVKFIDYLYPKSYLIKNLYAKALLESYGVHGFLYFQREDAFLALFKDGEYLYSKSLKFSFEYIYERFCELYGERVDEEFFYNILQEEGLKTLKLELQDYMMKLFGEIFLYINDILIYAKKAYEIEQIDMFYIGSETGSILGLNEYASSYLGIEANDFDFDYGMERSEWYIDQFHYLAILEALRNLEGEESPNFTLFFRPPPFAMRRSGRFLIVSSVSTFLALSMPVYNFTYDFYIKMSNVSLAKEEQKLSRIVTQISTQIARLQHEKKEILARISSQKKLFEKKKKILHAIYDKKVHYPMKAKLIVTFGNDMTQFGVKLLRIQNKDDIFTLTLYSDSEKKITQFIKYIADHYENRFHTNIDKIYKDKKSGIYHGDLKVTIL